MLTFEVPGEPRGKGRPRFANGHAYTDSETKAYEEKVVACYRKSCGGFLYDEEAFIRIKVTAYYRIPKSATKASAAGMESGQILPGKKPDIDNVLKIVLDALNGVAYKDDSRVVSVEAEKKYDREPRVVIELRGS